MPMPTLIDVLAGDESCRRAFVPSDVYVVTPPEDLPLSLEAARRHLNLTAWMGGDPARPEEMGHPDDSQILDFLAGAVGEIDGENGWLGRALAPRTLAVRLERLMPVALPYPPTIEVTQIQAVNAAGDALEDLEAGAWRLVPDGLRMRVEPAPGYAWPERAGLIVYRAGYQEPAEGALTPPDLATIRNWLKLRLTDLYVSGGTLSNVGEAPFASHMLANIRVRS